MTFEEFKAAHAKAFTKFCKYPPETIGGAEACEELADLEDAHPDWTAQVEAGQ